MIGVGIGDGDWRFWEYIFVQYIYLQNEVHNYIKIPGIKTSGIRTTAHKEQNCHTQITHTYIHMYDVCIKIHNHVYSSQQLSNKGTHTGKNKGRIS